MDFVEFSNYLTDFKLYSDSNKSVVEDVEVGHIKTKQFINEFWTSKQRQANSIHEIPYRACFKPQLPEFFIKNLTGTNDIVYDPFAGRGTTIVEASINLRRGISNDVNPLNKILSKPRIAPPILNQIKIRLDEIALDKSVKAEIDLSMFYHRDTEGELVSLKNYLIERENSGIKDIIDEWIQMVATSRLSGHSKGFFSVYTLPPNQAVTQSNQIKINQKKNQIPEYRDVKKLILRKSRSLLRDYKSILRKELFTGKNYFQFLAEDARFTKQILSDSVQLTVTSPPFLDVVNYEDDNWLRFWFNNIDTELVSEKITILSSVEKWQDFMQDVFYELHRITKPKGWVAFEVGEVRRGKVKLDEFVVPIGVNAGFKLLGTMINEQDFTKTSNIWGVSNNKSGTNTNRIVIFQKV